MWSWKILQDSKDCSKIDRWGPLQKTNKYVQDFEKTLKIFGVIFSEDCQTWCHKDLWRSSKDLYQGRYTFSRVLAYLLTAFHLTGQYCAAVSGLVQFLNAFSSDSFLGNEPLLCHMLVEFIISRNAWIASASFDILVYSLAMDFT